MSFYVSFNSYLCTIQKHYLFFASNTLVKEFKQFRKHTFNSSSEKYCVFVSCYSKNFKCNEYCQYQKRARAFRNSSKVCFYGKKKLKKMCCFLVKYG